MSTKMTIKHYEESTESGTRGFHLDREGFDDDNKYVYLEVDCVVFEASSANLTTGKGLSSIAFRLPNEWALKLGLIES